MRRPGFLGDTHFWFGNTNSSPFINRGLGQASVWSAFPKKRDAIIAAANQLFPGYKQMKDWIARTKAPAPIAKQQMETWFNQAYRSVRNRHLAPSRDVRKQLDVLIGQQAAKAAQSAKTASAARTAGAQLQALNALLSKVPGRTGGKWTPARSAVCKARGNCKKRGWNKVSIEMLQITRALRSGKLVDLKSATLVAQSWVDALKPKAKVKPKVKPKAKPKATPKRPAKLVSKAKAAPKTPPKINPQQEAKVRKCVNRLKHKVAARMFTPVAVCGKAKCSDAEYRAKCR
jgi:hypothetical protein